MSKYIKVNDTVKITTGDYKGKTGKVIKFNRSENKLKVENINLKTHFNKTTRQGITKHEGWINASNVVFWQEEYNQNTKLYRKDGKRFSKKTQKEV